MKNKPLFYCVVGIILLGLSFVNAWWCHEAPSSRGLASMIELWHFFVCVLCFGGSIFAFWAAWEEFHG